MYLSRHDFGFLHAEASGGLEAVMRPPGSVQGSAQGDVGMAPVLSGASSGFSSPLRESGHLESLLEVNSRVEAAMDRARAQLQAGLPTLHLLLPAFPSDLALGVAISCAFVTASVFVPACLQHHSLPLTILPLTALS